MFEDMIDVSFSEKSPTTSTEIISSNSSRLACQLIVVDAYRHCSFTWWYQIAPCWTKQKRNRGKSNLLSSWRPRREKPVPPRAWSRDQKRGELANRDVVETRRLETEACYILSRKLRVKEVTSVSDLRATYISLSYKIIHSLWLCPLKRQSKDNVILFETEKFGGDE